MASCMPEKGIHLSEVAFRGNEFERHKETDSRAQGAARFKSEIGENKSPRESVSWNVVRVWETCVICCLFARVSCNGSENPKNSFQTRGLQDRISLAKSLFFFARNFFCWNVYKKHAKSYKDRMLTSAEITTKTDESFDANFWVLSLGIMTNGDLKILTCHFGVALEREPSSLLAERTIERERHFPGLASRARASGTETA